MSDDDRFCRACGAKLEPARPSSQLGEGDTPPEGFTAVGRDDAMRYGDTPPEGFRVIDEPERPIRDEVVPPPPPVIGGPAGGSTGSPGPKRGSAKKIVIAAAAVVVALMIIGALVGDPEEEEGERAGATETERPSEPAPPPPASITVRSPKSDATVRRPSVKLKGESEPGAKVLVKTDAGSKRTKADDGGSWSVAVPLGVGDNSISVVATAQGHSRGSTSLVVTRERSAEELAAIRQRKLERQERKRQEFIASATTIPYNQLEKDPEEYAGERVKYTGQIFQIQEDYGSSVILLAVTDEGYGFWDDNIWVDYDGEIESAEDDIITIYGTVEGTKSYETQIGGETYVPQIKARYIDE